MSEESPPGVARTGVTAPGSFSGAIGPINATFTPAAPPPMSPPPAAPARPVRRGPRRVRLTVSRVDPWSVMKTAAVFGCCLLVVMVIAVAALYGVLAAMGVFATAQHTLRSALNVHLPLSAVGVVGGAAVLGAVNVVLMTALATVGAFIYNVSADLVGGLDLTLSEPE
ncbi:MAG: DUF3566 domain-containing protein [Mycobacteriales bacterium]